MSQSENQHLTAHTQDGVLVIQFAVEEIRGDDMAVAIRQELKKLVKEHNADKVVLDFEKVKAITSRGLGSLAGFYREFVKEDGGKVALCNVHEFVEQSLTATRFITGKGASPLADIKAASDKPASEQAAPTIPLFEHVTSDVDSAIRAISD